MQAQYRAGKGLSSDEVSAIRGGTGGGVDAVGISLVDPVNPYTQADRASKYGVLFVLLQLEDVALLVGSVFVFLVLALVMFLTRRIDWSGARVPEPV